MRLAAKGLLLVGLVIAGLFLVKPVLARCFIQGGQRQINPNQDYCVTAALCQDGGGCNLTAPEC
jgi:hypothetical protein